MWVLCFIAIFVFLFCKRRQSPMYRIRCMSNLLDLLLCSIDNELFAIDLLVSIGYSSLSIIVVLLKES